MTPLRDQLDQAITGAFALGTVERGRLLDRIMPIIEAQQRKWAEEFRRLAADWRANSVAVSILSDMNSRDNSISYEAKSEAFEQAAQMVEGGSK